MTVIWTPSSSSNMFIKDLSAILPCIIDTTALSTIITKKSSGWSIPCSKHSSIYSSLGFVPHVQWARWCSPSLSSNLQSPWRTVPDPVHKPILGLWHYPLHSWKPGLRRSAASPGRPAGSDSNGCRISLKFWCLGGPRHCLFRILGILTVEIFCSYSFSIHRRMEVPRMLAHHRASLWSLCTAIFQWCGFLQ